MYINIEDITKGMRAEVLATITRDDNAIAIQAITEAQAEVASYLSARYNIGAELEKTPPDETEEFEEATIIGTFPIRIRADDEVPDTRNVMVVKLVRDIAIYNCHAYSSPVNMPENRLLGYERAISFLRDVQAEKAAVVGLERLNTDADGNVASNYISFTSAPKRQHHF